MNREVIFCVAGLLSATPMTSPMRRGDGDFVVFRLPRQKTQRRLRSASAGSGYRRPLDHGALARLQLLARSQSGITQTLLLAHGVIPHELGRLLRTELATIRCGTIRSGDQAIEIGRVRITEAGGRAFETLHWPDAQ